jgi:hypothetical protein
MASKNATPENRAQFAQMLEQASLSQTKAAELIALQTMRPCSARAVRSWLADPELPSARACPQWAVLALQAGLKS